MNSLGLNVVLGSESRVNLYQISCLEPQSPGGPLTQLNDYAASFQTRNDFGFQNWHLCYVCHGKTQGSAIIHFWIQFPSTALCSIGKKHLDGAGFESGSFCIANSHTFHYTKGLGLTWEADFLSLLALNHHFLPHKRKGMHP